MCYYSNYVTVIMCHCSYPKALDMVASGAVDVRPLITHSYTLADSVAAFTHAKSMADGAIKIMIHCNKINNNYDSQ